MRMLLPFPFRYGVFLVLSGLFFSGCVSTLEREKQQAGRMAHEKEMSLAPSNAATYAKFRSLKSWKRSIYRDDAVLALATPENLHVRIVIANQRGTLFLANLVACDFPVSTGKSGHPTPTGEFKIIGKELNHRSNLYGRILDADGNVTRASADSKKDTPDDGDVFEGAPMPNFMRLTNDGVGLHIGAVPGYPASHGCVRLPKTAALLLYKVAAIGTPVSIVEKD